MKNSDLFNASRFLLFTYSNLDFDAKKDEAIKQAVVLAYKDATLMGAYNAKKSGNETHKDEPNAKTVLINSVIDSVKTLNPNVDFKTWHAELCNKLDQRIENFKYGNAQKLVNMTMKNMHVIYSIINEFQPENEFVLFFKRNILIHYSKFDIPVDSYILEAAWNMEEVNDKFENKKIKFPKKEGTCKRIAGKYSSDKIESWSSWDESKYTSFQNSLKDQIQSNRPLDWEYNAWIEIAKSRKK